MEHSYTMLVLLSLFFVLPQKWVPLLLMFIALFIVKRTLPDISKDNNPKDANKSMKIWNFYTELIEDKQVLSSVHIQSLIKSPKHFHYIFKNQDLKNAFEDLYVLKVFDQHLLGEILILTEAFMKIHFNVMIDKYNPKLNVQNLEDIVSAINDLFQRFVFNIPRTSSLFNIPDLDVYVEERHILIIKMLQRYVKIMRNKYSELRLRHDDYSVK